jgi:hypothetical protein
MGEIRLNQATGEYEEIDPVTGKPIRTVSPDDEAAFAPQKAMIPDKPASIPQAVGSPDSLGDTEYSKLVGDNIRNYRSSFNQPQEFPGPDFKPFNQGEIKPLPKLQPEPQGNRVLGAIRSQPRQGMGDADYQQALQRILSADQRGRAFQAGEQGLGNAMKLLLTTGSAIRTGAPPIPNLQSGNGLGAGMVGNAGMQMKALENQENRELRRDQMETNRDYRQFLQDQRLRSQERSDMLAGRIPPKGQDQLIFADNAIAAINRIRAKLPEIENGIGPVQGRIQNILVNVGIAEPNMAITNANLVELMARQVQSISGVAVSNQEFNRLRQAGPNIAQDPAQFKALLDNFEEIVKTRKKQVLNMYGKMGYNVDMLREEDNDGSRAGATRRIRNPSTGTVKEMPSDEADALIQKWGPEIEVR